MIFLLGYCHYFYDIKLKTARRRETRQVAYPAAPAVPPVGPQHFGDLVGCFKNLATRIKVLQEKTESCCRDASGQCRDASGHVGTPSGQRRDRRDWRRLDAVVGASCCATRPVRARSLFGSRQAVAGHRMAISHCLLNCKTLLVALTEISCGTCLTMPKAMRACPR